MKPSEFYYILTNRDSLYNIQAIDNIPSIMHYGLLSYERALSIPHASIAMREIQNRRNCIIVPNGMPLHRYANVYFDPKNPMLYKRKEEKDSICILEFDSAILDIAGAVVSDQNASSNYASFYPPEIGLNKIDFNLVFAMDWRDENEYTFWRKKSVKCAEVLIPYSIPSRYIRRAIVYDEIAGNKLEETGFTGCVDIVPKFFFE